MADIEEQMIAAKLKLAELQSENQQMVQAIRNAGASKPAAKKGFFG